MSTTAKNTFHLPFPPDVVLATLTDPAFLEANFGQQDNPDARVVERSRTADELIIDCEVTEYAKGMSGVDRSKTQKTQTVYRWNLPARKGEWTYKNPSTQGKMATVWGSSILQPDGSGTALTEEFNVKIKVPLMGGKIEKIIIKEVQKYWPAFDKLLRQWCEKHGT
jgi:hypothetical protein